MKRIYLFLTVLVLIGLSGCDNTDPKVDPPIINPPIINVPDTEAPVITLIGESIVTLTKGTDFIDDGTTVTDNVDEGLIASTVGTVDTSTTGTYTIEYNVIDSSLNQAEAITRTVHVVNKAPGLQILFSYESHDFIGYSVKTFDPEELYDGFIVYLYKGDVMVDSTLVSTLPYSGEFHNLEAKIDYDLYVVGTYDSGTTLGPLEKTSKTIQVGTYKTLDEQAKAMFHSEEVFEALKKMVFLPYHAIHNQECRAAVEIFNNVDEELILWMAEHTAERIILTRSPITSVPEYHFLIGQDTWDGRKFEDVSGVCCEPSVTRVGTSSNERDVILHEFGHSVDFLLIWGLTEDYDTFDGYWSLSETPEFLSIWEEEKPIIWPEETYFDMPSEYFAEAFQWYYYSEITNQDLLDKAPKTHAYMASLVDRFKEMME